MLTISDDIMVDFKKYLLDNFKECFTITDNPYPTYTLSPKSVINFSNNFGIDLVDSEVKDDSIIYYFTTIQFIYKLKIEGKNLNNINLSVKKIQIENYDAEMGQYYGYSPEIKAEVPIESKAYVDLVSGIAEKMGTVTLAETIIHSAGWVYDRDSNFYYRPRYMGY